MPAPSTPSRSPLGRFLVLSGMAVRIAGGVLGQRVLHGRAGIDWQPVGELLGEVLGSLKGPVLKLGQMGAQWQGILPEPILQALGRLQNQVPALPYAELYSHLRQCYGGDPGEVFRHIEPQPFAAASLAQVHRAVTADGQPVILKVQYPGMAEICRADLQQLRRLLPLGRLFKAPAAQLEALYWELSRSIAAELDYSLELQRLLEYRRHFVDWPGLRLPTPREDLCRPGILVLSEESGLPMSGVRQASPEVRRRLADTLIDWLLAQAFDMKLLHADPHAGNFAYTPAGELVVYDFGCILPLSPALLQAYIDTCQALQQGSVERLEHAFQGLGTRQPQSAPPWGLYRQLIQLLQPRLQPGSHWDFATSQLHQQALQLSPEVMGMLGSLQPSAATVMVNRTLEGHYWSLLRLGVPVALVDRLEEALARR
ncbi:putative protein kinase UbiB [compost metagenome]